MAKKKITTKDAVDAAWISPPMAEAIKQIVRAEMTLWQSEFLESLAAEFVKIPPLQSPRIGEST